MLIGDVVVSSSSSQIPPFRRKAGYWLLHISYAFSPWGHPIAALGRRSSGIHCLCSFHFWLTSPFQWFVLPLPSSCLTFSIRTWSLSLTPANDHRNLICYASVRRSYASLPRGQHSVPYNSVCLIIMLWNFCSMSFPIYFQNFVLIFHVFYYNLLNIFQSVHFFGRTGN
jgi:hypothetical protein